MCYECSCDDPEYIYTPESITDETFKKAAKAAKISVKEAKWNTLKLLKRELEDE